MTRTGQERAQPCFAQPLGARDDDIVGTHKAQDFARNLLDDVGIWLFGGEQGDVALEIGAHSLKAFDLELQQG